MSEAPVGAEAAVQVFLRAVQWARPMFQVISSSSRSWRLRLRAAFRVARVLATVSGVSKRWTAGWSVSEELQEL